MDIRTNDMLSQIRSKSLPRTDSLNVSDIKAAGQRSDTNKLYTQFYTFVKELTQVLEGDLRVKLAVPEGNMGALAEICNALIEKLVLFSRWTLYSAEQTISTSHIVLDHTFVQAQVVENQIRQIAKVVGTLEGVVASTQRLNNTLHLNAAIGREQEEISHALTENAGTIEASISDLYTITQSLYASSVQVLQTTEHIGELIEAAEDWKHLIEELHLPEEEPEEAGAEWLL
jgi:methyl-accepting chemotaxis protein